jgi:hypothetical protein
MMLSKAYPDMKQRALIKLHCVVCIATAFTDLI